MMAWTRWLYFFFAADSWGAAILFYTKLPWPASWPVNFDRIARWVPLIGLLLGIILLCGGRVLLWLGMDGSLAAALVVVAAIALTGGLHLDGVGDSADGLAVTDPARRLEVMRDSQTGAYGVMAIAVVLLLKTLAFGGLTPPPWQSWALVTALVMGRWGQLLAIGLYPYLRAAGKGAGHRRHLQWPQDLSVGTASALGGILAIGYLLNLGWGSMVGGIMAAAVMTGAVGYWFAQKFGGHTGDTYGAVVEWSEVLILLGLNLLPPG